MDKAKIVVKARNRTQAVKIAKGYFDEYFDGSHYEITSIYGVAQFHTAIPIYMVTVEADG